MSAYKYINNTASDISAGGYLVPAYSFLVASTRPAALDPYVNAGLDLYIDSVKFNNYTRVSGDSSSQGIVDQSGNSLGGDVTSALIQIATKCMMPTAKNAGLHQAMTKSIHISRERLTSIQIGIPNFYLNTGVEVPCGSTTSATMSIEYPVGSGNFYQCNFSGQVQGTAPDGGFLLCDARKVNIPPNKPFAVLIWRNSTAGILYTQNYSAMTGEGFVSSASTTPDLTMGGSITAASVNIFMPCCIIGYSNKKAVAIIGDSNGAGSTDTNPLTDKQGDISISSRSVSQACGYINLAVASDSCAIFLTNTYVNRAALAAYCTDIIWQYGTNDISGASTAAALLTNLANCVARFPNHRNYVCTVPPRTTSSDAWVTTTNQTVLATESVRITANTGIRQGVVGAEDCFDLSNALETSWNSGIIKIDVGAASPAMTIEGVHFLANASRMASRSGFIPKYLFASRK